MNKYPHSVFKLTQKLYNNPLLISQGAFNSIEAYLSARNSGLMVPLVPEADKEKEQPDDLDDVMGVGIIQVYGPLTNKSTGMEAMCGGCSYESILSQCDDMVEAGCSTIILCIDSGGGEANGAFDCATLLRQKCNDAGAKLLAYNEGSCCSAAYLLACVCDEVVSGKIAETGSVGVLISLMDKSKYLEQEGLKPVFVTAGKEKVPYADDGSFKDSFLEDLQGKADYLYEEFVNHVTNYTSMTPEQIRNTEAKTYMAEEALSLGLINKIMSSSEFVDYIVSIQKGASNA